MHTSGESLDEGMLETIYEKKVSSIVVQCSEGGEHGVQKRVEVNILKV